MRAALLGALVLGALAAPAAAAPYVHNVNASPMGWVQYNLTAGRTYVFTTSAPVPATGDTVLRLVRGSTEIQSAMNDDLAAGNRMSRITYTVPANSTGTYHLFVLAKAGTAPGTVQLTVTNNGAPMDARAIAFGGTTINVPVVTAPDFHEIEAVLTPNGARDTTLLAIDGNDRIFEIDADSGVGLAARIARVGMVRVIVGAPAGMNGPTTVYVNDRAIHDNDCDGVGRELERELGICDLSIFTGCAAVVNLKDSDRDGLEDAAELYGLDTSPPQYLARWGANPRRKDLFLELDWFTPFYANRPIDEGMILAIRDQFAAAPGNQILNLDGSNGIQIHVDAGFAPPPGNLSTVYGEWGGASGTATGDVTVNRASVRKGIFRHGLLANGGSGFKPGDSFTTSVGAMGTGLAAVQTFLQEVGHNLNLAHEGYELYDWGVNCSPIYRSPMSYASWIFGPIGYSNGTAYRGVVLNPTNLCEQRGLDGGATSHLTQFYDIDVMGNQVDWNNDGEYSDCNHPVRAAVNWMPGSGCDAQDDGAEHLDIGPTAGQSGSFVHSGDWGYVFAVKEGVISYRVGSMPASARADAGCPNGDERFLGAPPCTTWGPVRYLGMSSWVQSLHAFAVDGTIYIGFTDDRDVEAQVIRMAVQADGSLASLGQPERIGGSRAANAPDFQIVQVDPWLYNQADRIVIATWVDPTTRTARWSYLDSGHFIGDLPLLDQDGAAIAASGPSPSPVFWGVDDGTIGDHNQTWMALPDGGGRLAIYRYEAWADHWVDMTAAVTGAGLRNDRLTNKIGFAFRPLLDGSGNVMDPRKGDFFLAYKTETDPTMPPQPSEVHLRVSTVVNGTDRRPDTTLRFEAARAGQFGGAYTVVDALWGDVDLYTDPSFPHLKGVYNQIEDGAQRHLTFLPWADGVFDLDLHNGSDFEVMERGICLGLRGEAFCGPKNQFGF